GGHVLEPRPGLYRNVMIFDFKSLYPSLIRTVQLDPLGQVLDEGEAAAAIRGARELTLSAAREIDAGSQAREAIAIAKVGGARMLFDVIDRAIQVYGAAGLTPDTPLSVMYRHAREARIYDG
ncbi:hypothetical protein DF186_14240, partial [Enterococcus hirae]